VNTSTCVDRPALSELYDAYNGTVYVRCRRILKDPAAAEDAVHETFLRVQRHLSKAPCREEMRAWICRIATNYCLNEIRNRNVRARPLPEFTIQSSSLEEVLAARSEAKQLLLRLPERVRAVAWLTYVDGMQQNEVSQALGISRRTVVNRISELLERVAADHPAEPALAAG
jgi:RNA polymerase sigma-70 factor, ECF subfamily